MPIIFAADGDGHLANARPFGATTENDVYAGDPSSEMR